MAGDNEQTRAAAPRLDWQPELDAAMAHIDQRLRRPRQSAAGAAEPPAPPAPGAASLTPEMMDEIAWRVAEQMRLNAQAFPAAPQAPQAPQAPEAPQLLRPGKMLMIRFRMPSLPWPFRLFRRRRRQHPLTTAKLRA